MIGTLHAIAAARLLATLGVSASLVAGGVAASGDANIVTRAVGDLSATVAARLAPPSPAATGLDASEAGRSDVAIRGTLALEPPAIDVRAMLGGDLNADAAGLVTWTAVPAPSNVDLNLNTGVDAGVRTDIDASFNAQTTLPATTAVAGLEAHPNLDLTIGR